MLQFLQSKSLFEAERALRSELAYQVMEDARSPGHVETANLYPSELEAVLGKAVSATHVSPQLIPDLTPVGSAPPSPVDGPGRTLIAEARHSPSLSVPRSPLSSSSQQRSSRPKIN